MAAMRAGNGADQSWAHPALSQNEVWKELLWQHCHFLHRALKGSPGDEESMKAPGYLLLE